MEKYKEMYDGLSDELKAKITTCKTADELIELAKSEGIELTDEQLDAISGGYLWWVTDDCDDYESCQSFD